MDTIATEFLPGARLGPYEIVGPLGAGGMGQVYKARDTRMGRMVAIKVSFERFSGRFEREVRAISALKHPNICTLYDVGPNYVEMDDEVLKYSGVTFVSTLEAAEVFALAGETTKALDWLKNAVRNGDDRAQWFRRDPWLASIRQDPRFSQILESIAYRQKQLIKK